MYNSNLIEEINDTWIWLLRQNLCPNKAIDNILQ